MSRLLVVLLSCFAAAAMILPAAAQSPSPTGTTTPGATTTPTPPSVPDAAAFRDALLALALDNLDAQESPQFMGFFPAWSAAYPGLTGGGALVASTPGKVSTVRTLLDSKNVPAPDNPTIIAFAVAGQDGACAGAVIYGFPKTDKTASFTVSGTCTAQAVIAAFIATQQPTPPPITTVPATVTPVDVTAPKPPATGDSLPAAPGSLPILAGAAALFAGVVATAAAGFVLRRAR